MLHPQDLQDFREITGDQPIPPGFEAEYLIWLRMQHRRKQDGPLGSLLVVLCRQFNLAPPDDVILPGGQVNWRQVQKGQRVAVKLEGGGIVRGEFVNTGNHNRVEVKLDNVAWHQDFPPYQVSLDLMLPADIKVPEPVKAQMTQQLPAHDDRPVVADDEQFPRFDQTVHGSPERISRPRMSDPKWYELTEGADVVVAQGGQDVPALFKRLHGPGQIIVEMNGEDELVDESYTTIPAKKVAAPKKTKAPRKVTKKKARAVA